MSFVKVLMFRLNFATLQLAQPENVDNKCIYDQFIVSGGNTIPAICGINNGLHSKFFVKVYNKLTLLLLSGVRSDFDKLQDRQLLNIIL